MLEDAIVTTSLFFAEDSVSAFERTIGVGVRIG